MRFTEKQLFFGTIGLFTVAVLAFGGFGYHLWADRWSPTEEAIAATTAEIAELKKKAEELNQLKVELAKLKEVVEQFQMILPSPEQVRYTEFVNTIKKWEIDANVSVTNVTRNPEAPRAPGPGVPFTQISYTLTVEGGFYDVARFVYYIETFPRFIKVDNLTFTPKQRVVDEKSKDKDLRTLVGATIVISTYTF